MGQKKEDQVVKVWELKKLVRKKEIFLVKYET